MCLLLKWITYILVSFVYIYMVKINKINECMDVNVSLYND